MVVSAFAIGALSYPVFFLGFIDTILVIFFINILGIIPVSFFSTFGPRFGLRQMVLSRFYFGWYGVKLSKFLDLNMKDQLLICRKLLSSTFLPALVGLP